MTILCECLNFRKPVQNRTTFSVLPNIVPFRWNGWTFQNDSVTFTKRPRMIQRWIKQWCTNACWRDNHLTTIRVVPGVLSYCAHSSVATCSHAASTPPSFVTYCHYSSRVTLLVLLFHMELLTWSNDAGNNSTAPSKACESTHKLTVLSHIQAANSRWLVPHSSEVENGLSILAAVPLCHLSVTVKRQIHPNASLLR